MNRSSDDVLSLPLVSPLVVSQRYLYYNMTNQSKESNVKIENLIPRDFDEYLDDRIKLISRYRELRANGFSQHPKC